MSQPRVKIPFGPLAVTLLLIIVAGVVLGRRSAQRVSLQAPAGGLVRTASWDLGGEDLAAAEVVDVLRGLNADVIALQGVSDSLDAAALAEALPGSWRAQSLPGPSGRHLAVLMGPRLSIVAYHLVPTSAGDAVAVSVGLGERATLCLVSLESNPEPPRPDYETYVNGVLTWCSQRRGQVLILAGRIDLDGPARGRLTERFRDVCTAEDRASEIRVTPQEWETTQAGYVEGSVGSAGGPALVDLRLP